MTNPCIKQKKLLWFKWNVIYHNYSIWSISKFMFCSEDFEVTFKCSKCDHLIKKSFVTNDELLLMGFSPKDLSKVNGTTSFYPTALNNTDNGK